MNLFLPYFGVTIFSYLIGSIPFSLIFAKLLKGVDVRNSGTGNVGATNALISAGFRAGTFSVVFDIAKGFAAVIFARIMIGSDLACALAGLMAIVGHDFSFYLNFSGGKGIATTGGVIIAINPYLVFMISVLYVVFLVLTRYFIVSSLAVLAVVPIMLYISNDGLPYVIFGILSFMIALYTHREDILRIISGKEAKAKIALNRVV